MPYYIETRHLTRFSDLDTQRHVTSRTYESFTMDARYALMEREGLDLRALVEADGRIEPERSYVRFISQQWAGAELVVRTWAYPEPEGRVFWSHSVEQPDGTPVCHLVNRSRGRNADGSPRDLLADGTTESIPDHGDRTPERIYQEDRDLLGELPAFSGSCKRLVTKLPALYSARNIFAGYNTAELWRIFEDGRWFFAERLGLTYQKFVDLDTILFFMGADFQFRALPAAGQELEVHTWAERFEKIRSYLRQDVYVAGQSEPILSVRENSLVVSLSRARPKRPPAEYIELVRDYLEFPPE